MGVGARGGSATETTAAHESDLSWRLAALLAGERLHHTPRHRARQQAAAAAPPAARGRVARRPEGGGPGRDGQNANDAHVDDRPLGLDGGLAEEGLVHPPDGVPAGERLRVRLEEDRRVRERRLRVGGIVHIGRAGGCEPRRAISTNRPQERQTAPGGCRSFGFAVSRSWVQVRPPALSTSASAKAVIRSGSHRRGQRLCARPLRLRRREHGGGGRTSHPGPAGVLSFRPAGKGTAAAGVTHDREGRAGQRHRDPIDRCHCQFSGVARPGAFAQESRSGEAQRVAGRASAPGPNEPVARVRGPGPDLLCDTRSPAGPRLRSSAFRRGRSTTRAGRRTERRCTSARGSRPRRGCSSGASSSRTPADQAAAPRRAEAALHAAGARPSFWWAC
jgi:hypothetical protein